ncbi:tetratricopeptide repeat-containing hybrid sensor histidine kinase/response regulator [Christiangramia forsetii]|uniref:histidine kinase n=2 Tax=Christiangramia forsetii TaxID=411153 RepID=A0M3W5_CHRFK|nr:response regulator [Christiangramia forsetii]GGG24797.1 histidine kinase [Christiangramia forsetii]CAL67310.1 two-component system sensor histidine kinase/response regulator hybrid [Christiangramia forsetii KT0803]
MTKSYTAFFLLFILCWSGSSAQTPHSSDKDSLKDILKEISVHIEKYRYDQAIEDSHDLLNLAKEKNNLYYVSHAYNSLGHAYLDQKDSARARKNYALGLEYAQRVGNDTILMRSYNNLGNIYSEIPETTEKGIDYYNKVIDLAKKLNDPSELIIPKANIGWTYLDNNKYQEAYPYLKESLQLMDSIATLGDKNRSYFYSQIYMLHGRYFGHEKQFDTASYFFDKSIELAVADSLVLPAAEAYKAYAKMLEEEGDFEAAYMAQLKFNEYNSMVFESEKLRQMEIANARFSISEYKKNLEIAEREQNYQDEIIEKSQEKVIIMVISSVILVFILVFLYKINHDRRGLISELKNKNKQYKEAKVEAENLSLLKTRFFSTVSHEIRTPLYGVIGLTSLLLEEKSLGKHKSDLKSLKFSADYLLALINDVLQMNKMESNEVNLESVSFNPRDLLNSILNSFEFTRVQNKNELHLDFDENIPSFLLGDSIRLSQVLMNLVGNAMKFTERGNIYFQVKQIDGDKDHSKIYFEIRDDGPGIPESKKKVIFEEFSQLDNSNYNYQGTGLGLPIVKRLLKLFNSKIKLDSKEGEGSTFSFSILFDVDTAKAETIKIEEDSYLHEYSGKKCILIVDDNRINQVVTRRILEKKDFICEVAGDGMQAIELVKNGNFDLVLMDVNMPGISGLEASKKIREFNKIIPVLALTAVEVEEIREEIHDAGMSGIIIKPYDVQQFYQIVYKHLSIQRIVEEV